MSQPHRPAGNHARPERPAQPHGPRPDLDAPTVNLTADRRHQFTPSSGRIGGVPVRALQVGMALVGVALLGLVLTYALSSVMSFMSRTNEAASSAPSSAPAAPAYSAEEQDFLDELGRYGVAENFVERYPREWIAAGKYVCSNVELNPTYGAVMNWSTLAMNADLSYNGQAFYGYRNGSRLVQASLRGLCPPPYSG